MKYNYNDLISMKLEELRDLAKEMGVKRVTGINKPQLINNILDFQAEHPDADTLKEEEIQKEQSRRRRRRIIKKEPAFKVSPEGKITKSTDPGEFSKKEETAETKAQEKTQAFPQGDMQSKEQQEVKEKENEPSRPKLK